MKGNGSGREHAGHAVEVASGQRFAFGENWRDFLERIGEEKIRAAARSIRDLTGFETLAGKRFLDVGSGSGLFSLAAMRLGAGEVCSFDYDPGSVACARELRDRFHPGDDRWKIREGSVLDREFLSQLGLFDIVYSWGVLHHTGDLWRAMENVGRLADAGGLLILAIYNDQGRKSRLWKSIKKAYCRTPRTLAKILFFPIPLFYEMKAAAADLANGRAPFGKWRDRGERGMTAYHDWIDWLGGYPFEVAKPADVSAFFERTAFETERIVTCGGGSGNNEYVFRKRREAPGTMRS